MSQSHTIGDGGSGRRSEAMVFLLDACAGADREEREASVVESCRLWVVIESVSREVESQVKALCGERG